MKIIETLQLTSTVQQIVLFWIVFGPVEWLFALRPSSILRTRRLADLAHGLFNAVVLRAPLAALVVASGIASQAVLPAGLKHFIEAQRLALQVFEAALIGDLGIYTAHRLLHSRLLWRFHAIHHSAEDLDWLVALRMHPVDLLLMKSFSLLPVLFLGFSPLAIGIYLFIYAWMSLLDHANVTFTYGPLRHLIVGPEFHHWHHANADAAHDRNFAAQFVLWDWLFGTLHLPNGRRPDCYGVSETVPPGFADQLCYPFRRPERRDEAVSGPTSFPVHSA